MKHLLALALCLSGFAALAFAARRQQRHIFRRSLPLATTTIFRVAGAGALLYALGILVAGYGWDFGLVMFSGHTSISAGIVYGALVAYAQTQSGAPHR